jgi:hypothetical protein
MWRNFGGAHISSGVPLSARLSGTGGDIQENPTAEDAEETGMTLEKVILMFKETVI